MKTREEMLSLLPINLIGAELGVFEGEFSKIILNKIQPSVLFLVDIFKGEMCSGDKNGDNMKTILLESSYNKLLEYYKNTDNVKIIKDTTINFLNSLNDDYLDFVYIDADHTYDGVYADLMLSRLKVKNNGYILGHDYTPRFQGCMDAVNCFVKQFNLNLLLTTEDICSSYMILNVKN
jgi:hypothetical protein